MILLAVLAIIMYDQVYHFETAHEHDVYCKLVTLIVKFSLVTCDNSLFCHVLTCPLY